MYIIQVNTPKSQLNSAFVQLTPEYKTTLNIKTSCIITVQRRVNGNLMNIFYLQKSCGLLVFFFSTFSSECRPSTQAGKLRL